MMAQKDTSTPLEELELKAITQARSNETKSQSGGETHAGATNQAPAASQSGGETHAGATNQAPAAKTDAGAEQTWKAFVNNSLDSFNAVSVAPHSMTVKNYGIGILSSGMKLIVLGISLYALFGFFEYQEQYPVQGIAVSSLKGVSVYVLNGSEPFLQNCETNDMNRLLFDTKEFGIIDDYDSFFVTTNMWLTCNQSVGICGEDERSVPNGQAYCLNNTNCTEGKLLRNGNGPQTGTCNLQTKTCNVLAWCPVEAERKESNLKPKIDAANFTVLIKNTVSFPNSFSNYARSNIYGGDEHWLKNCTYDKDLSPGCPIFTLGQIVSMISPTENFTELSIRGAVIAFNIEWNCDLDETWLHPTCTPVYSVAREDRQNGVAAGYHFRFTRNRDETNGTLYRTLVKAYGIRVIVRVNGLGRKASLSAVATWLGTSLAYFTSVTGFLTLLIVYGYLNYFIQVQEWIKSSKIYNCCGWKGKIGNGILYGLISGFCCCCILLPIICGCGKDKSQSKDDKNDENKDANKDYPTERILKLLAGAINVIWILVLVIFMVIPVLTMFMIVVLASILSLVVLCCLRYYHVDRTKRLKKVLNTVLSYEIHHDTYAAAILKRNWEGNQEYGKEKEKGCAPNHVVISFDDGEN